MADERTTPDLLAANRQAIESGGRRDFDGAMTPYRPESVWDTRLVERSGEVDMRASVNLGGDGVFERITNFTDIDEARAAAEGLAEERG